MKNFPKRKALALLVVLSIALSSMTVFAFGGYAPYDDEYAYTQGYDENNDDEAYYYGYEGDEGGYYYGYGDDYSESGSDYYIGGYEASQEYRYIAVTTDAFTFEQASENFVTITTSFSGDGAVDIFVPGAGLMNSPASVPEGTFLFLDIIPNQGDGYWVDYFILNGVRVDFADLDFVDRVAELPSNIPGNFTTIVGLLWFEIPTIADDDITLYVSFSSDIPAGWHEFVPATGITGLTTTAAAWEWTMLTGEVTPATASVQNTIFEIIDDGDTGAILSDNGQFILATSEGTVELEARLVGGGVDREDFTQNFTINVTDGDNGVTITTDFSGDGGVALYSVEFGDLVNPFEPSYTVVPAETGLFIDLIPNLDDDYWVDYFIINDITVYFDDLEFIGLTAALPAYLLPYGFSIIGFASVDGVIVLELPVVVVEDIDIYASFAVVENGNDNDNDTPLIPVRPAPTPTQPVTTVVETPNISPGVLATSVSPATIGGANMQPVRRWVDGRTFVQGVSQEGMTLMIRSNVALGNNPNHISFDTDEQGNTLATISADFLEELEPGTHTISINFAYNLVVRATFRVR